MELMALECEIIHISIDKTNVTFSSNKIGYHQSEINIKLTADSTNLIIINDEKEGSICQSFRLSSLKSIIKLCNYSKRILIQMGPDVPLGIAFEFNNDGKCQLFISPLIINNVEY